MTKPPTMNAPTENTEDITTELQAMGKVVDQLTKGWRDSLSKNAQDSIGDADLVRLRDGLLNFLSMCIED